MNKPLQRPLLLLIVAFGVIAVTGFVWWRLSVHRHVGYYAILVDPSDSQALDRSCDKARAVGRKALNDPRMARGGKVAVFGMGRPVTANEPELKGIISLPDTSAVMPGESGAATKHQEFENEIVARCKEITPTTVSPLFASFTRVVEFLQRQNSDPEAYLAMFAITDGEETEVKEIKRAFTEKPGTKIDLPMTIDNQRVHVELCGFAETIGEIAVDDKRTIIKTPARTPERAARETEVWANAFSEQILIKPYCVSASPQIAER
jgi:hypothetical protein